MKSLSVTIQKKAIVQYFPVMSICDAVYYAVQGGANI